MYHNINRYFNIYIYANKTDIECIYAIMFLSISSVLLFHYYLYQSWSYSRKERDKGVSLTIIWMQTGTPWGSFHLLAKILLRVSVTLLLQCLDTSELVELPLDHALNKWSTVRFGVTVPMFDMLKVAKKCKNISNFTNNSCSLLRSNTP